MLCHWPAAKENAVFFYVHEFFTFHRKSPSPSACPPTIRYALVRVCVCVRLCVCANVLLCGDHFTQTLKLKVIQFRSTPASPTTTFPLPNCSLLKATSEAVLCVFQIGEMVSGGGGGYWQFVNGEPVLNRV